LTQIEAWGKTCFNNIFRVCTFAEKKFKITKCSPHRDLLFWTAFYLFGMHFIFVDSKIIFLDCEISFLACKMLFEDCKILQFWIAIFFLDCKLLFLVCKNDFQRCENYRPQFN
jgi:hypothetical protein